MGLSDILLLTTFYASVAIRSRTVYHFCIYTYVYDSNDDGSDHSELQNKIYGNNT